MLRKKLKQEDIIKFEALAMNYNEQVVWYWCWHKDKHINQ